MRTSLIIPAAGRGLRFGSAIAKQFLPLEGLSILAHSLRAFAGMVDEAVIASGEDTRDLVQAAVRDAAMAVPVRVVHGGATRLHSVAAALDACQGELILVHDAVRPLVPSACIRSCLAALSQHAAALVAVPCTGTVKRVDGARVLDTVPREHLWLAQTPQGFHREVGRAAFARAIDEGWECSDDAQVLERSGCPVVVVSGDERNLKITTAADLLLVQALLRLAAR